MNVYLVYAAELETLADASRIEAVSSFEARKQYAKAHDLYLVDVVAVAERYMAEPKGWLVAETDTPQG